MSAKIFTTTVLCLFSFLILANTGYGAQPPVVIPLNTSSAAVIDYIDGNQSIELSSTTEVIRSLTLEVPKTGLIVVNATGYFKWHVSDRTSAGRCTITTDTSLSFNHLIIAGGESDVDFAGEYLPFAGTRVFPVSQGTHVINLVCNAYSAATGDITVDDTSMNAIFYYFPDADVSSSSEDPSSMENCPNPNSGSCN